MFKKLPTYDKSKTFSQNIRDSIPSQNTQNSTVENDCEEDEELIGSSQSNFTLPKPKMFLRTKVTSQEYPSSPPHSNNGSFIGSPTNLEIAPATSTPKSVSSGEIDDTNDDNFQKTPTKNR